MSKRTTEKPTPTDPAAAQAPLSPYRAFVVQFRAGAEPNHFAGRVEHMTSGQAVRSSSAEELLSFIASVLRQVRPQPRRRSRGGGS